LRIEFRAPNLVRGFGPLVESSFLFGACRVNTMLLKKTSCGARCLSLCALSLRVVLAPPAFAFSPRQRLHWTGPVSCWHHYHLNTADVVSVRAHSVSAVCACAIVLMSYERQLSRPRRAQGRSPLSIRLLVHALPTVTHLRLHWTGPPAPLSRGILFSPPTNPSASRPQPQARRATSSRPLGLPRESTI
jgi:hypothetical protein